VVTLLLLPGMDGTGRLFGPFVEALPKEWRVQVVRYPLDRPLGYAELEPYATAAVPPEGPWFMLGESFSGPIAISMARKADRRLKGVILCCTFARSPTPLLTLFGWLIGRIPLSLLPNFVIDGFLLGRFRSAHLSALLAQALSEVTDDVLAARLIAARDIDVSAALAGIERPMLYLKATEDRLIKPEAAALICRMAQQTTRIEIHGPHCLLQAAPEATAAAVKAFINSHLMSADD